MADKYEVRLNALGKNVFAIAAADATPDVLDQLAAIQADIVERFLSRAITLTTGTTPTTGTLATAYALTYVCGGA